MRKITLFVTFLVIGLSVTAQEMMDRVPKQLSFEAGYRYMLASEFPNQASHGYTAIFDYAWQLSGFDKKKSSYITVPIGYTVLPADNADNASVKIVSYGWTVRHELAKDKKVIPFMGYALLLNQYNQADVPGRLFGHQTRFALGANFMTFGKIIPYAKIEYSMTNYPVWGEDGSRKYNFIGVKVGFRFNRKS